MTVCISARKPMRVFCIPITFVPLTRRPFSGFFLPSQKTSVAPVPGPPVSPARNAQYDFPHGLGWGTVSAYLERWAVQQSGNAVIMPPSWLVPGFWHHRNVMLKVARIAEEARGGRVLAWWAGCAAAGVYEVNDHAILMDRASGPRDLIAMCQAGLDDEATQILCETIASLHNVLDTSPAPADVVPLSLWFHDLIETEAVWIDTDNIHRVVTVAREMLEASHRQVGRLKEILQFHSVRPHGAGF